MTTRITTPFTAESTAADVTAGVDLTGRRAVVTGGASGIGVETARALAGAGAAVTIAVRDQAAGQRTARDITASTGNEQVHVAQLDLADRASIAGFVAGWAGPLHILVNNAGVMGPPLTRTPDGWELHFATNHMGHFALATGLHRALAAAGDARVVSVSSSQHRLSPVVFEDINFEHRPYDPNVAYGQSKTANALFAVEAAKRWSGDGITVNAVMPGIIRTNLMRHANPDDMARAQASGLLDKLPWKTVEQGAATSVLVAASPLLVGVSGRYFEDCQEAGPLSPDNPHGGVADYALDPGNAARLWEITIEGSTTA
ncbi:NAD(P)-dependent dehydrogenase (short-subunit alcohol dehydrogenase family) [Kibdelosporangium banguiense]|uniref:NAD(P)-dependent dehydrogenase (Short-subunit alcohol dehydrogenase family) n=1 Tax=Kibdelosporangium banguiense TaxID=1365924 RepID=A0ABS4TJ69_9PSEU|nr:SDR family NAD(P)-dependent oxidoreductase [Kibdelosporangium banguiense]MBP2324462.1 NAD(P)-dependent dehydrogenase (short-subunit alcohol dehydrogenase family) [Kibdelosporangium banguiense]